MCTYEMKRAATEAGMGTDNNLAIPIYWYHLSIPVGSALRVTTISKQQ